MATFFHGPGLSTVGSSGDIEHVFLALGACLTACVRHVSGNGGHVEGPTAGLLWHPKNPIFE